MYTHRWVKTSSSDFLETREAQTVVTRLNRTIDIGDIATVFVANGMLHVYALDKGNLVPPQLYSQEADRARLLIERSGSGWLCLMGQLWVNRNAQSVGIANVTIGALRDGKFVVSETAKTTLRCKAANATEVERILTRIVKAELKRAALCV